MSTASTQSDNPLLTSLLQADRSYATDLSAADTLTRRNLELQHTIQDLCFDHELMALKHDLLETQNEYCQNFLGEIGNEKKRDDRRRERLVERCAKLQGERERVEGERDALRKGREGLKAVVRCRDGKIAALEVRLRERKREARGLKRRVGRVEDEREGSEIRAEVLERRLKGIGQRARDAEGRAVLARDGWARAEQAVEEGLQREEWGRVQYWEVAVVCCLSLLVTGYLHWCLASCSGK